MNKTMSRGGHPGEQAASAPPPLFAKLSLKIDHEILKIEKNI
jgi:hypothetical protein